MGETRALSVFAASEVPSLQNNPYTKVAHFGGDSDPLQYLMKHSWPAGTTAGAGEPGTWGWDGCRLRPRLDEELVR